MIQTIYCVSENCIASAKTSGENLRFITVIHPFGATGELKANMVNAEFTDQVAADPAGAAVKVTVNDKEYNLSYTL